MSKLVSIGLIAAAMFASPAMAAWYDKNGAAIHPSRVVHCIRAPDEGQLPEVRGSPPANRQPRVQAPSGGVARQKRRSHPSFARRSTASGLQT